MRNASPSRMVAPNSFSTAAQQAGKAPRCSGSTTCCATTLASVFMSAHEASCDSRTMVENPVRNSAFCISCTMPPRLALTTSRSMASTSMRPAKRAPSTSCLLRDDEVLPGIDAAHLADADDCGAVELVEDSGPLDGLPDVDQIALVDRTGQGGAIQTHRPGLPPRLIQRRAGRGEFRQLYGRSDPDAAHAMRHDLHRLL